MDDKIIKVTCKEEETKTPYFLLGMDKIFNYYNLKEIDSNSLDINKEDYPDYHIFIIDNNARYYINTQLESKNLQLSFIESYKGISLLINSTEIYDKYRVYEVEGKNKRFILDSNDFVVLSDKIKNNHVYYIEAYKKVEDYYLLVDTSEETECIFKRIENKEYELTIGIPIFNGENFIARTIDSILFSSCTNYRILLVNDGSKDDTTSVIKWYKEKYDFIDYIEQSNRGASYSRNIILDNTETPYVAFIDADDLVSPNMYKLLLEAIKESDADVAICKTLVRENDEKTSRVLNINCDSYITYSYEQMVEEKMKNSFNNIFFVSTTNKIVKTEIATKIRFPKKRYYEDSAYTPTLYSYAKKFVFVGKPLYVWDKRKRSTEGTFSTSYDQQSIGDLINYYFDATVYPIENGNPKNKEFVIYSALKDLITYFDKLPNKEDPIYIKYEKRLKKLVNSINIKNKYILNDDYVKRRIVDLL